MADTQIETQGGMRDDLVEMLRRELLGPFGGPEEILRQRSYWTVPGRTTRPARHNGQPARRRRSI